MHDNVQQVLLLLYQRRSTASNYTAGDHLTDTTSVTATGVVLFPVRLPLEPGHLVLRS
jgi:FixJ family two-component response regulator